MTCHSFTLIEIRFDLKNLKFLFFSVLWKVLVLKPSNYLKFSEVSTYKLRMKKRQTTIQLIFKLEVCILFPLSPSWFAGTNYSLVVFQFCTLTTLIHKPNTRKIPQNYMITLKVSNPMYNQLFFFFFNGISQHYKTQQSLPLAIHSHLI